MTNEMIVEMAFRYAMGDEVDDMPHDFDSLETYLRDFLSLYLAALPPEPEVSEEAGCSHCACLRCRITRGYTS